MASEEAKMEEAEAAGGHLKEQQAGVRRRRLDRECRERRRGERENEEETERENVGKDEGEKNAERKV